MNEIALEARKRKKEAEDEDEDADAERSAMTDTCNDEGGEISSNVRQRMQLHPLSPRSVPFFLSLEKSNL